MANKQIGAALYTKSTLAHRRSELYGNTWVDQEYLDGLAFYRQKYVDQIMAREPIDKRVRLSNDAEGRIVLPELHSARDWHDLAFSLPGVSERIISLTHRFEGIFAIEDTGVEGQRFGSVYASIDIPQNDDHQYKGRKWSYNQGHAKHAMLLERPGGNIAPAVFAGEFSMSVTRRIDEHSLVYTDIVISDINNHSGGYQVRGYLNKNLAVLNRLQETFSSTEEGHGDIADYYRGISRPRVSISLAGRAKFLVGIETSK